MSNLFLSYRFTGEDPKELYKIFGSMLKRFEFNGHKTFCSLYLEDFFKKMNYNADKIYDYCLNEQSKSDTLVSLIKSEHESVGMKKELENGIILKQKKILLIRNDLDFPFFRMNADKIIEYKGDISNLYPKLHRI